MPDEAAESSRFRMRDIPAGVNSWMAYTPLGGRSPLGRGLVQSDFTIDSVSSEGSSNASSSATDNSSVMMTSSPTSPPHEASLARSSSHSFQASRSSGPFTSQKMECSNSASSTSVASGTRRLRASARGDDATVQASSSCASGYGRTSD